MILDELYSILLYSGGAIALGLVSILVLGCFVGIQAHFNNWLLALIFPIILTGIGISSLLSGRNIIFADANINSAVANETELVTWLFRFATLIILGICFSRFISTSQKNKNQGKEGYPLFFAFLLFYFTNIIINNIFGTKPTLDQKFIYSLIIFSAVFFSRNQNMYFSIQGMKFGLLFFLFCSSIAALVFPKIAVQNYYIGWVPGINIRFWGLASHANSIGPLSLVFLLIVAHRPFDRRWLQYSAIIMGICIILLSQSKTAWVAAFLSFAILWWGRVLHPSIEDNILKCSSNSLRSLSSPILLAFIGILLVVVLAVYSVYGNTFAAITNNEATMTLTGRTAIWSVAIEAWKNNPLFGYGSSIWSAQFRENIDMDFAFSAHNQFLQSLSGAGVMGLLGLMIYMLILFRYAYAAIGETRGLSLALFSVILVRCFTETPFEISGILNVDIATHLLLFRIVLINRGKQKSFLYPQEQQQLRWR